MNPTKTQKTTFQYVVIVLSTSVLLLELISFCSTGWMRLEGIEVPEGQQLTEDNTRNRRSYDRYTTSSQKPPLGIIQPNYSPNREQPKGQNRPSSGNTDNTGNRNPSAMRPSTNRPSRPSNNPARPGSGGQDRPTRGPKPTISDPVSSPKYPQRPTRGPLPSRRPYVPQTRPTKIPPDNKSRPTKPNPNISYPPRPTRVPLPSRRPYIPQRPTKTPPDNKSRPTNSKPNISYPPRPTRGPLPQRTKVPSSNRTRPVRPIINITYPPRRTRGPIPNSTKTLSGGKSKPTKPSANISYPPKPTRGPLPNWSQYRPKSPPTVRPSRLPAQNRTRPSLFTRTRNPSPPSRKPTVTRPPKPAKAPNLSGAQMNFITNLVGQINSTWSRNKTAKFIKNQLVASGLNFLNPYGIDYSRIVALFKRSGYDTDTMSKILARSLSTFNPGANVGDLVPGQARLPSNGANPTNSGNMGKGGVSDGLTDAQSGNTVVIEIGLWTAVICRGDMRTGMTECEHTGDTFDGILHDRTAWSMVDVRIEAVFAITFGMIGSLCSVLMVNPWCLKQKHRLLLIGGICGLTISGLLYFITIGRVVAIKGVFEQEADRDYDNVKKNTPWCLYLGGLGAGLAFVTSGILATSKWVESRKDYSEFGDEVVFTKEGDKPATEA